MSDESPFSIEFDRVGGVLKTTVRGHWTVATLAGYAARLLVEGTRLRWRREPYDFLSDARAMPVQSQAVANGFSKLLDIAAANNVRSIAIVVGSTLNKIQAERTLSSANVRIFLTMEEATDWLAQRRS